MYADAAVYDIWQAERRERWLAFANLSPDQAPDRPLLWAELLFQAKELESAYQSSRSSIGSVTWSPHIRDQAQRLARRCP